MTSGSLSRAGRPTLGSSKACSSFHQSSTSTYNETKKESRSSMAPSFGESLVHQHTILAPSRLSAITHQTSEGLALCVVAYRQSVVVRAFGCSYGEQEEGRCQPAPSPSTTR